MTDSNLDDISDELQTIRADEPRRIRARALSSLLNAVDADAAVFSKYTRHDGVDYYTDAVGAGDSQGPQIARQFDNTPTLSSKFWDPRSVAPEDRSRFVPQRAEIGPIEDIRGTRIYRSLYGAHGIKDQLRILVYDGPRFLGWLAILRRADRPFELGDAERVNRLSGALCQRLSVAEDAQDELLTEKTALLLSSDGERVMYATPAARRWLDKRRRASLRRLVRAWKAGRRRPMLFDASLVRLNRLHGADGVRFLMRVDHTQRPIASPTAALSPRQRQVAEFAAVGATVDEIAKHLDISPNTVKSHLKKVYRRLEVENRVGLGEMLGD